MLWQRSIDLPTNGAVALPCVLRLGFLDVDSRALPSRQKEKDRSIDDTIRNTTKALTTRCYGAYTSASWMWN